ncbi:MAG: hypothetical protein IT317_15960 [Anaerolineales bacterium]|nr:hypothetical protein [Anaerolineales bacterium]
MRRKKKSFQISPIDAFDARQGFRRCKLPGIGVYLEGVRAAALADFWRDRSKRLVIRVSRSTYVFHYEAHLADGKNIPDTRLDDFDMFLSKVLLDWLCEPEDDIGEPDFD